MSRNEQSAADRGEQEECHDEAACGFIVTHHHHHHQAASTEDDADTPTSEESNMDTEPKQEKTESVGLQSGPIKKYEAGGAVSRGFLTRRDIPPVDPAVLVDLEAQARDLASNVDRMMKSLNTTIQNMTALSVGYIQTYRDSVDSLGESVDLSIKAMYTLMARTEELDKGMQPVHGLAKQIKDVKRLLDHLENLCK